jgi:DNA-binding transcriptional MerR regulator
MMGTQAARRLAGVSHHRLVHLIRVGQFEPPAKDETGRYTWTEADVERLRQVAASRQKAKQPEAQNVPNV